MKKILSVLIILTLNFCAVSVYAADEEIPAFSDIGNCWANAEITAMKEEGIVTGYEDGRFNPDNYVTRAEFAVMIARVCKLDDDYTISKFDDVSIDDWYAQAVNGAYFAGIIKGVTPTAFDPHAGITMQEAAVMANRAYKIYKPDDVSPVNMQILDGFKKLDSIDLWAREDVAFAAQRGLLYRVYENGYFDGKAPVTRATCASILYRLHNAII